MAISTIPFGGFYNSLHDSEIDTALENMFLDRETGCERNKGLEQAFFDKCDFTSVHQAYAKAYAVAFGDKFGIKLEFESLSSPKEYNFTTDRIFVTIADDELTRLHTATKPDELESVAKEMFTSRSGFSSSYSNDVEDWGPLDEWDHNQIGALIQAYVNQEADSEFDGMAEVGLMESVVSNGYLEGWLSEAAPNSERLYRIHTYLEDRKDRE